MPDAEQPIEEERTGFDEIKGEVDAGKVPKRTVRDLLSWFGARRRGTDIVEKIEKALKEAGIQTDPHFTMIWIDGEVTFKRADDAPKDRQATASDATAEDGGPVIEDANYVVGMLGSANRGVISVNPDDSIEKAITLMILRDFSQLAVMTAPRELKGAISWKSIGMRLSQKVRPTKVRDATDPAEEIQGTASLFDTTRTIIEKDFVFVRAEDRTITGIVTASDLSEQFHALSEPFLILGRIEAHMRRVVREASFDVKTLRSVVDEKDADRKANLTSVTQLTYGEYQRLFQQEAHWKRLGFVACRKTFCDALGDVRQLRNEIMHFHPDALEGVDIEPLKQLLGLLETLKEIKA